MSRLVERDQEIGVLHDCLRAATRGDGRLFLIEGPAGIGKTSLLGELTAAAKATGVPVLHARGSQLERDFPFGVARQLFETALVDEAKRQEALSGAAAAAWSVLGPVADDGGQAAGGSFAALHGLFWLTLNLAGDGPLVVAIDDLHASDAASLRFVGYLARRVSDLPLMVAATVRSGELGTDAALLGELTSDPATAHLVPRSISGSGVGNLVADALGEDPDAEFCDACASVTGGNPLLLTQLLAALADEDVRPRAQNTSAVARIGPRAVSRTVLLRLARLPADATEVARAIAVLGDGSARSLVARLVGMDEQRVEAAARSLAAAGVLHADGRDGFAHALLRDAVYLDMSAAERERWHLRAVALLRELDAPGEQIAAQLIETPPGREPWAAELLRDAGRTAVARGAPDAAVAPLRRALQEPLARPERAALLVELGNAEAMLDAPRAIEHLREAYDTLEDPLARARTGMALAAGLAFTGAIAAGLETARRVIEDTPPEFDDIRCGLEAIAAFQVMVGGGGGEADLRRLERLGRDGRSDGVGGDMLGLLLGTLQMWRCEPVDRCLDTIRSALTDRLLAVDDGAVSVIGVIALGIADQPDALAVADRCRAEALRRGSAIGDVAIQLWRGFVMLRRGELVEAEAVLREALGGFPHWAPTSIGPLFCAGWLARVLIERGDVAAAADALDQHDELTVSLEGARRWRRAKSDVLLAGGDFAAALAVAEESAAIDTMVVNPANDTWRSPMARALAGLRRTAEAVAIAEEDVALARRFGSPPALGRALCVLAAVAPSDQVKTLAEAVAALEGTPARLDLAKALGAQGAALRRGGRPTEAREPLRRALELADRCGATPLATNVRTELRAAGVRPRATAVKGVESLTPSERRVAALAAEGRTNREIAQSLYVTPKTIEVHLYNAYRKLEIRSRRELPEAGLSLA